MPVSGCALAQFPSRQQFPPRAQPLQRLVLRQRPTQPQPLALALASSGQFVVLSTALAPGSRPPLPGPPVERPRLPLRLHRLSAPPGAGGDFPAGASRALGRSNLGSWYHSAAGLSLVSSAKGEWLRAERGVSSVLPYPSTAREGTEPRTVQEWASAPKADLSPCRCV